MTHGGFVWLKKQVSSRLCSYWPKNLADKRQELSELSLKSDERDFLKKSCPYLPKTYLDYLENFRFRPSEQVDVVFSPIDDSAEGNVEIKVAGKWVETILYEIPLLVLVSEAYFRFANTDWDYEGQEEKAHAKAQELLSVGCIFSEFGTRRRRSYCAYQISLSVLFLIFSRHTRTCPPRPGPRSGRKSQCTGQALRHVECAFCA